VYRRYFFAHPDLSAAETTRLTHVDYLSRLALVVVEEDGRLAAVARYERIPGTSEAEVAFVVADDLQRQGVGSRLLAHLAVAARMNGIDTFVAETQVDNCGMLAVFWGSGFPVTAHTSFGTVSVRFPIVPAASD
jgi:GNAT superfamily N-acetyltransferase